MFTDSNINHKTTGYVLDKAHELMNKFSKTTLEELGGGGVYVLKVGSTVVYVGSSVNDVALRYACHIINTTDPNSCEYNKQKYIELRKALAHGYQISCQKVADSYVLEEKYIKALNPPLNSKHWSKFTQDYYLGSIRPLDFSKSF